MKLAVLLLVAACTCTSHGTHAETTSRGSHQDKSTEQSEAPDKQVEYITGPNVGIVGPTVLGGKGQEVQPLGEDESHDKDQRDVSNQGVVYPGYEFPTRQEDSKESEATDAEYAKYAVTLNTFGPGGQNVKYLQPTESSDQSAKYIQQLGSGEQNVKYIQQLGSDEQTLKYAQQLRPGDEDTKYSPQLGSSEQNVKYIQQLGSDEQNVKYIQQLGSGEQSLKYVQQLGSDEQTAKYAQQLGSEGQSVKYIPQLESTEENVKYVQQLESSQSQEQHFKRLHPKNPQVEIGKSRRPSQKITYYQTGEKIRQMPASSHGLFRSQTSEEQSLAHLQAHIHAQTTGQSGTRPTLQEYHRSPTMAPQEYHRSPTEAPQEYHRSPTEAPQEYHRGQTGAPQEYHRSPTEAPQEYHRGSTAAPQEYHQNLAETQQKQDTQKVSESAQTTKHESSEHSTASSSEDQKQESPENQEAEAPRETTQEVSQPQSNEQLYIPQEYLQYHQLTGHTSQLGDLQQYPEKQLQFFSPQEAMTETGNSQEQPGSTTVQSGSPHFQTIPKGHQVYFVPAFGGVDSTTSTLGEHQLPSKQAQGNVNFHQLSAYYPQQLQFEFRPQLFNNQHTQSQQHLLQQSIELTRPSLQQSLKQQSLQPNLQGIQYLSKPHPFIRAPIVYRQRLPQRVPQRQNEHLGLITIQKGTSSSLPHHHLLQSQNFYTPDTKLVQLQAQQNIPKLQSSLAIQNIQSPTAVPVKIFPVQQLHLPFSDSLGFSEDKTSSHGLRPFIYPLSTAGQVPESSRQTVPIPTEPPKLYHTKVPSYIKTDVQATTERVKPFGFSHTTYGHKPGSYSYSIFNKHS